MQHVCLPMLDLLSLVLILSSLAATSSASVLLTKNHLSHNHPLMESLLERYEKIAMYLGSTKEEEKAEGRKLHRWLYTEMALDDVKFDRSGFEYVQSKFNRNVIPNVKIMIEWEDGGLYVKVRPSYPHEHAKTCLDASIILWLFNMENGDVDSLHRKGSAGDTYL